MEFKKCTISELTELQFVSRETYEDTFSQYNTKENMEAYLEKAFHTDALTKELLESASAFYLAYAAGQLAGYLKVNEAPAQTELNDVKSLELERIYLRKSRRGSGEGKLLLDFAIHTAKQRKKEYLWLGVWEKNEPAIRFYEKHGFRAFSEHDFWLGNDCQRDILMRLGWSTY